MGRLCALLLVLGLSGCVDPAPPAPEPTPPEFYAARQDAGRTLSAVDILSYDPSLRRQRVRLETTEAPGTILIDTSNYHLYLVEADGWAMRYGVAIGREGFGWTGAGRIARRAAWPRWTPPPEMIAREPALAKFESGMPGGPRNPLGARALYVYQGARDTLIRVHGTNAPLSIGTRASSGCFRMLNQDVIDLYARVPDGAKIIVF
ncbi:MAG: L,D-transpeptidase [Pseudomonadota bacterium]